LRKRKLHTRKVNRHVAWAKSSARHRNFGLFRLHAYMKFQVINVMVQLLCSMLWGEFRTPEVLGGNV
jgi:hypothetical protein